MKNIFLAFILSLFQLTNFAQYADTSSIISSGVSVVSDSVALFGTLTIPKNASGGIPLVIIISGSGATDRDGNNKSAGLNCDAYKKLAYALASQKIACIRIDKRGVGESILIDKSKVSKTLDQEIADARVWLNHFHKDKRFGEVIIAGHSLGGLVGLLASEKAYKYISLNGMGNHPASMLKEQLAAQGPMVSEKANIIIDSLEKGYLVEDVPPYLNALFRKSVQPYLMSWFKYDPALELSKIKIPSLIIQGDNDVQIKVDDARYFVSKSPSSRLIIIKGMNHLFKIVPTDRMENLKSYGNPKLPIAQELVDEMVDFIHKK